MTLTRRRFLRNATLAGAALSTGPWIRAQSSTKPYRTALVGCGWWGNNILGEAMASGACRITALCDVDQRFLTQTADRVEKESGAKPARYRDYRELFQREQVDIAIVATPDHWHPLQTIAAVNAGAHVYVEKPVGHTIREGRAMVTAARATDRVVTVGTHRRVSPHNLSACEFLRSGKAGKIGAVRCFVVYGGGPEQPRPNTEPPAGLDWNLWCGPAPLRPYNGDPDNPWSGGIHPRGFRQYLDYANGQIADWGVHWFDQVLWILDRQSPTSVHCAGGRPIKGPPVLNDREQTSDAPDSQFATYEFEDFTLTWEHRLFAGNGATKGENVGCLFFGTKGTFHLGWRNGWTFYPADNREPEVHEDAKLNQPDQQNIRELWADFLDAIGEERRPVCDIEIAHRATNLSLLGMLSWRLGRSIEWDGEEELCPHDAEANKLLQRAYREGWKYPT